MGDNLPYVNLGTNRTAKKIASRGNHTCAILDDGSVKCWGHNNYGQLGLGDIADRGRFTGGMGDNLETVQLGTGRTAIAIVVHSSDTCVLLDNSTIKCWGYNGNGNLGLGNTDHRGDGPNEMGDNLPAVDLGTGRTPLTLTAGNQFTCVVFDDTSVKCWGHNAAEGRLGLGDAQNRGDGANEMGDNLPIVKLFANTW